MRRGSSCGRGLASAVGRSFQGKLQGQLQLLQLLTSRSRFRPRQTTACSAGRVRPSFRSVLRTIATRVFVSTRVRGTCLLLICIWFAGINTLPYIPTLPTLIPAAIILKLADHITDYYPVILQAIKVLIQLLLRLQCTLTTHPHSNHWPTSNGVLTPSPPLKSIPLTPTSNPCLDYTHPVQKLCSCLPRTTHSHSHRLSSRHVS